MNGHELHCRKWDTSKVWNIIGRHQTERLYSEMQMAIAAGQIVPVVYVDLDEDEEAKILASMDPLSSMAITDSRAPKACCAWARLA